MKKFLFWFAVAKRRQAETHLIILDSVQKRLEFQPKGTAMTAYYWYVLMCLSK